MEQKPNKNLPYWINKYEYAFFSKLTICKKKKIDKSRIEPFLNLSIKNILIDIFKTLFKIRKLKIVSIHEAWLEISESAPSNRIISRGAFESRNGFNCGFSIVSIIDQRIMGRTMTLHLSKISQILLSKDHPIKASVVGGFDDFDSMKSEHLCSRNGIRF